MQTIPPHFPNFPRHLATVGPQPLTQKQRKAMEPLENAIGDLGANRETLEELRAQHSRNSYRPGTNDYGNLHNMYFKRGTAAHHRNLAEDMKTTNRFTHSLTSTTPIKDIANIHAAIANRIDEVKAAHVALSASHPTLAWKDGSMGRKNRKYKTLSGATQSLGKYHGKKTTPDGTPETFEGGRKTRKHKRKIKKRKRKTRKRKHKRKTKRKHKKKN